MKNIKLFLGINYNRRNYFFMFRIPTIQIVIINPRTNLAIRGLWGINIITSRARDAMDRNTGNSLEFILISPLVIVIL